MTKKMIKLRFILTTDEEGSFYTVKGFRSGEWTVVGTCHLSAKEAISNGTQLELLKFV